MMAKPNIVLIVADDLGYSDSMPLMDSITQTKFTQFYGAPVCTPARASLLTGFYGWRMGLQRILMPWSDSHIPFEIQTLPELLKKQGYRTTMVGKWHLGHTNKKALPTSRGFDSHYGSYVGAIDYYTHTNRGVHDFWRNGVPCYDKGYTTDLFSKEALSALKDSQPFFLYVPYTAPHGPIQPPPGKDSGNAYRHMLEHFDNWLRRIIKKALLLPNTFVFFSADNGSPRKSSVGRFRGIKRSCFEGGVRVPAFACGPNILKQTLDAPFHISDFFATICELTGCKVKKRDGMSLTKQLFDGHTNGRQEIIYNLGNHPRDHNAIRSGDFKLIMGRDEEYLFNIKLDPYEKNPLSNKSKKMELKSRLKSLEGEMVPFDGGKAPRKFPKFWGST